MWPLYRGGLITQIVLRQVSLYQTNFCISPTKFRAVNGYLIWHSGELIIFMIINH